MKCLEMFCEQDDDEERRSPTVAAAGGELCAAAAAAALELDEDECEVEDFVPVCEIPPPMDEIQTHTLPTQQHSVSGRRRSDDQNHRLCRLEHASGWTKVSVLSMPRPGLRLS